MIKSLVSKGKGLINKGKSLFGGNAFEKAYFIICDDKSFSNKANGIKVQFNPSELNITRNLKIQHIKGIGQDSGESYPQVVFGLDTRLTLTLYFDSYTNMNPDADNLDAFQSVSSLVSKGVAISNKLMSGKESDDEQARPDPAVNRSLGQILELIKFEHTKHRPSIVGFIWGSQINFEGIIESSKVKYTAFSESGVPVRAIIKLSIVGEEKKKSIDNMVNQNESPDRTKSRTMQFGEKLWMIAYDEYDDPNLWRVLADRNQFLNPRKIESVIEVEVPSIQ